MNLTTQSTSARLLHDFSPNWHAMMGGLAQRLDRFIDTPVNTITDNTGDYSSSLATGFAPRFGTESDLGYITGTINKWGIKQDVVLASNGYRFNTYSYTAPSAATVYARHRQHQRPDRLRCSRRRSAEEHGPLPVRRRPPAGLQPRRHDLLPQALRRASGRQPGLDRRRQQLRHRAHQRLQQERHQPLGQRDVQADLRHHRLRHLRQQPRSRATSLPAAPSTPTRPSPPTAATSGSSAYKTDGKPLNISTALFRLQRPFANTVAYGTTGKTIFEISGMQVNYGAEISAQGTLFHRLLIDGGFTALDARLTDTGIAATNDKRFVGIPGYHSNLLSEYRVPGVANLSITGDWEFTGRRPQDDENLHSTPGFNTFDFGFRYSRTLFTKLATLRFTTNNITDTRYYSTIAAGDITGTNASSNTAHMGSPRSISSSLEFSF